MSERCCGSCGIAIPDSAHFNRKYCSKRCQRRAWLAANIRCSCGNPKSQHSKTCHSCWRAKHASKREERRKLIHHMWHEGFSMGEIATAVPTTENALGGELVRMRNDGWDLPFRRAPSPKQVTTKAECRARFNTAITTGEIRRPARCEECGEVGPVDGHHPDYSRPLYVFWLCRSCHAAHHLTKEVVA